MLFDLSAEYRINRYSSVRLSVDNLTDRYYLEPLARIAQPGSGRTVNLDLALRY
jgi:hemoglobin/transferrin/lactoferrin receptor protein